jgi:hypothetical protein
MPQSTSEERPSDDARHRPAASERQNTEDRRPGAGRDSPCRGQAQTWRPRIAEVCWICTGNGPRLQRPLERCGIACPTAAGPVTSNRDRPGSGPAGALRDDESVSNSCRKTDEIEQSASRDAAISDDRTIIPARRQLRRRDRARDPAGGSSRTRQRKEVPYGRGSGGGREIPACVRKR